MISIKHYLPLLIAFLFLNFNSNAQTQSVNDPLLIAKAHQYAAEVFRDYPLYAGAEYMPDYIADLSRVEIKQEAIQANENYKLLSSFELKDKYNSDLEVDNASNFKPEHFNALKYFFNFYAKTTQKIRVDNSTYVIVIHPKL